MTTKKTILALVILGLTGCDVPMPPPMPPPMNAEEAVVRQQDKIKRSLSMPDAATDVALLPGETNWATYTLVIDGKQHRFLYYRSYGSTAVLGLTEVSQ